MYNVNRTRKRRYCKIGSLWGVTPCSLVKKKVTSLGGNYIKIARPDTPDDGCKNLKYGNLFCYTATLKSDTNDF